MHRMRKKVKTSADSLSALYAQAIYEYVAGTWAFREIEDRGDAAILFAIYGSHTLRIEVTEDVAKVFMAKPEDGDTTCVLRVSMLDPMSFDKIKNVVSAVPKTRVLKAADATLRRS